MTVKEAVNVLKFAKEIRIAWNGNAIPFNKDDMLMMDAYGSYKVDSINADDEKNFEIEIAMRPVKEGECA